MSTLVPSSDSPLNNYSVSKIEDYRLGEKVIELYLGSNFKPAKIARECNKLLAERKDGIQYVEINTANVIAYLKSHKKELELSGTSDLHNQVSLNLVEEIHDHMETLKHELEMLRNSDAPVLDAKQEFFLRLSKELRGYLQILADMGTKLQPAISVAKFKDNVDAFLDAIAKTPDDKLPADQRQYVINLACDKLITNDLLKNVTDEKK